MRLHAFWFRISDGRMLAYCGRENRYRPAVDVLSEKTSTAKAA